MLSADCDEWSHLMEARFDFRDLFVLDLANNHQGSVEHGLAIIRSCGEIARGHGLRAALKFQFRQLDSFIHPSHRQNSANKHIPRFLSTRLERSDYQRLLDEVRAQGMLAICTPFDEASVPIIVAMGFDILKVASCSSTDWPLIEAVAAANKPVIFSTGGIEIEQIDDLVSFIAHRNIDAALMHCVSIYPTPEDKLNLANIAMLKARYPQLVIGWSTHEDQDDVAPVQMALALGAGMFERHVGIATDSIALNAYSSNPEQLDRWMKAYQRARRILGHSQRGKPDAAEVASLQSLQRGVYVKRELDAGVPLTFDDVYFAMPCLDGQLASGAFKPGTTLRAAVSADGPVMTANAVVPAPPDIHILKKAVHEVKAMLNLAGIELGPEFEVEYSHHEGVENFKKTGVVIINCINREYCKKILVQLPGQSHPWHFHRRKEETFQVLWGEMKAEIDGRVKTLRPGDTALVLPGVWHRFWTETGVIFEEISTTHYNDDSVYKAPEINGMKRKDRKTVVDHWGRFQLAADG
jgi:N-acetylneuraminate synthase